MQDEEVVRQSAEVLEKSFKEIKKTLLEVRNSMEENLHPKKLSDINRVIEQTAERLDSAIEKTQNAKKFADDVTELENMFSAGIQRELERSTNRTILLTVIIAVVSIVASIGAGIWGSISVNKSNLEIQKITRQAEDKIEKLSTLSGISWLTKKDYDIAFGKTDDLKKLQTKLVKDITDGNRNNKEIYEELARQAINVNYTEDQIKIIKSCLFYLNKQYQHAIEEIREINSEKLLWDRAVITALSYSELNNESGISRYLDIVKEKADTWVGFEYKKIHEKLNKATANAKRSIKSTINIGVFDASPGIKNVHVTTKQAKIVQAYLQTSGWSETSVHTFDYGEYSDLVGELTIGLNSQFMVFNPKARRALTKDLSLIPQFGDLAKANSVSKNSFLNKKLLEHIAEENKVEAVILVGTEFGGVSPNIPKLKRK